ncbi:MAG: flagellar motor protein MotB [Bdellovibrionota bacterium]|nr:MAG: flagellar motor protein MotB [Bdellovibrionota bacterium]
MSGSLEPCNGPTSAGWLVSFGDLLTLLLAFFVASVAGAGPHVEQDQAPSSLSTGPTSGIDVANFNRGDLSVRNPDTVISVQEISWNGVLSGERMGEIAQRIPHAAATAKPVRVVLCTAPFEGEMGLLTGLGSALIEQLRQGGIGKRGLIVELRGSGCRTGETAAEIQWDAANLTVPQVMEKIHG